MISEKLVTEVYYFSLIMARTLGFFVVVPIFGSKAIPNKIKISLALIISLLLRPTLSLTGIEVPNYLLIVIFQIIIELFIGFIIGFIMLLSFIAIQLAGQFLDRRMGFAMASLMDPQSGVKSPLMGQFKNLLATLLFLSINGHHNLLKLLNDSFEIVAITNFESSNKLFLALFRIIGDLFPLGLQLALPIMAILFIVDLAFGLVARVVPQINVFIMGLPTKIIVGMIFLMLMLPSYINSMEVILMDTIKDIYIILKLMIG